MLICDRHSRQARRRCLRRCLKVRTLLAWLAISLVVGGLIGGCAGRSAAAGGAGASRTRAIQNKGSDTMVNLALAWAEAYREVKAGPGHCRDRRRLGHRHRRADQRHGGHRQCLARDEGERNRRCPKERHRPGRIRGGSRRAGGHRQPAEPGLAAHHRSAVRHLHRAHHQLAGGRRRRRSHRAGLARDQFGHACLLSRRGGAQGRQGEQGRLCPADAADALLGRHYQRSAAQPECHRLRWSWLCGHGARRS